MTDLTAEKMSFNVDKTKNGPQLYSYRCQILKWHIDWNVLRYLANETVCIYSFDDSGTTEDV